MPENAHCSPVCGNIKGLTEPRTPWVSTLRSVPHFSPSFLKQLLRQGARPGGPSPLDLLLGTELSQVPLQHSDPLDSVLWNSTSYKPSFHVTAFDFFYLFNGFPTYCRNN